MSAEVTRSSWAGFFLNSMVAELPTLVWIDANYGPVDLKYRRSFVVGGLMLPLPNRYVWVQSVE